MRTITFHAPNEAVDGRPLPPVELVVIAKRILGYVAPSMGYKHPRLFLADRREGVEIVETQAEFQALVAKPAPASTMRAASGGGKLASQMRKAGSHLAAERTDTSEHEPAASGH